MNEAHPWAGLAVLVALLIAELMCLFKHGESYIIGKLLKELIDVFREVAKELTSRDIAKKLCGAVVALVLLASLCALVALTHGSVEEPGLQSVSLLLGLIVGMALVLLFFSYLNVHFISWYKRQGLD